MKGAEEIASSFVVTVGNGAVWLELDEEMLDQGASFVQRPVTAALNPVGAARGNPDLFAGFVQRLNPPLLCVIGFVRQDGIGLGVRQQHISADEIVSLSGGEGKPRRMAQGVHRGGDLRAQPASATPDG